MGARIEPTWHRGMYGCPQDMYGASVVLPLVSELEQVRRLHEVATERTVALAAVIEQARDEDLAWSATEIRAILASADTSVLADRDAEKWDEGFDAALDDIGAAAVMREHGEDMNPYYRREEPKHA